MHGRAIDAVARDDILHVGVHQDMRGDRLAAANNPLAGEILLQLDGFRRKSLRNAADTALMQGCQPGEVQFAVLEIALPQTLILHRQQQTVRFREFEFPEQRRGQQRQRIDAGEGDVGAAESVEPGREEVAIGQRGEQDTFFLALRFPVTQRVRGGQSGREKQLFELAPDYRQSVAAAQEGDGLDLKTFFGDVREQREGAAGVLCEVGGKRLMAAGGRREYALAG